MNEAQGLGFDKGEGIKDKSSATGIAVIAVVMVERLLNA